MASVQQCENFITVTQTLEHFIQNSMLRENIFVGFGVLGPLTFPIGTPTIGADHEQFGWFLFYDRLRSDHK